ncbi:MAG TPA: hypothetical protein PKA00_00230 [Saprospiraceae bacterium]|nr:hypothetical protein [Saprospiraceae bacterium]HMQ81290.1 hypothetical protein [Saprospiraceae bacterium]
MKKITTRTVLFSLLLMASAASYIFLNIASWKQDQARLEKETPLEEDLEAEQNKLFLPDVQVLKKLVETGRKLVP